VQNEFGNCCIGYSKGGMRGTPHGDLTSGLLYVSSENGLKGYYYNKSAEVGGG